MTAAVKAPPEPVIALVPTFSPEQIAQLLKPIAPSRVAKDGKGNSHVTQQDVTAHLIRIFGFGSYDLMLVSQDLVFEEPTRKPDKNTGKPNPNNWDVCYITTARLVVRNLAGQQVCLFEQTSTGDAQNQGRADAHDLALKASESLAKKRCAKELGDQFGLSLYNKGQMSALVKGTIADPNRKPAEDVQAGVEQQSLGDDEGGGEVPEAVVVKPALASVPRDWPAEIAACTTMAEINELFKAIKAANAVTDELKRAFTARSAEIRSTG